MILQSSSKRPPGFTRILLNLWLVTKTVRTRPNNSASLAFHLIRCSLSAGQAAYLAVDSRVAGATQVGPWRKPSLINANTILITDRLSVLGSGHHLGELHFLNYLLALNLFSCDHLAVFWLYIPQPTTLSLRGSSPTAHAPPWVTICPD